MDRQETYEVEQALAETPPQTILATAALERSFGRPSRRALLRGAVVTVAGAAVATSSVVSAGTAHAEARQSGDSTQTILNIATTAEELAVTFLSHGIANSGRLGLQGTNLAALEAARVEEQLHLHFLASNGGKTLQTTFSFPHGAATFTSRWRFVDTLLQLEADFIAAYLAAVREFASMRASTLAGYAAQIMGVESEHRVLARSLGGFVPPDNLAFEQAILPSVGAAVGALKSQGYLSPNSRTGNAFAFSPVSTAGHGVISRTP
ncbi:MAG: ferritin-like domain-containing protein [Ktedonobacterales bacterium]|nr:ferritin-like domain-containing protein [Ktedonobacterales bacterium]